MFFEPRIKIMGKNSVAIDWDTRLICDEEGFIPEYFDKIRKAAKDGEIKCRSVEVIYGIPDEIKNREECAKSLCNESYALIIGEETKIFGNSRRGIIYALATLLQLQDYGELSEGLIYDAPDKTLRGYKIFTPGREEFEDFDKTLDKFIYYKYNTLMIEVGGAMEYKKHPKINEEWQEYATNVKKVPGLSQAIQYKYSWGKNSLSIENGAGGYISQEEMKCIIDKCKEREIDVIPEVPSLSHSDYIVRAYREINERVEDEYPDTYCPSNPRTYEILFDIIDEVCDVFEPEYMNIGHDEYYTSAKCPLCKGKDPADLYADDIKKIYTYLKSKGIKTMMWGEKILNHYRPDGSGAGGAGDSEHDVPPLYTCVDKIPNDITMINWYWSIISADEEMIYHNYKFPMIYGNYNAMNHTDYRERMNMGRGCIGGFVSNWGSFRDVYMQRNCQNLSLAFTAWAFWNNKYDGNLKSYVLKKTEAELYRANCKTFEGKSVIEVVHTTDLFKKKSYPFYDGVFIYEKDWKLGYYKVTYASGEEANLQVVFGYNISSIKAAKADGEQVDFSEGNVGMYSECIGACLPVWEKDGLWYKTIFENPRPLDKIERIEFIKTMGAEFNLYTRYIKSV